jgi:hypothetical protein
MEPLTLAELPEVATPADVARVFHTTENALSQDRYLGRGLPYVKIGRRVRYLRADVTAYLEASRTQATKSRSQAR